MAPNEFFVRLQKGITGGFAPPTPSETHALTRSKDKPDQLVVNSQYRADGTPSLQSADEQPKILSLDGSDKDDNEKLIEELQDILKTLPTEQPPGSQDIYGMDISIAWGSHDLEWCNGGPGGVSGRESSVQPTAEEKAKFERAVEIVKQLAKK